MFRSITVTGVRYFNTVFEDDYILDRSYINANIKLKYLHISYLVQYVGNVDVCMVLMTIPKKVLNKNPLYEL